MKSIIFAVLVISLAGCGAIEARKNSSALLRLNVGDTKEQVIAAMGRPAKREVYGADEFWLYKTDIASTDMGTFTPILISNGRVAGWGRNYYNTAQKSKIEADIRMR